MTAYALIKDSQIARQNLSGQGYILKIYTDRAQAERAATRLRGVGVVEVWISWDVK